MRDLQRIRALEAESPKAKSGTANAVEEEYVAMETSEDDEDWARRWSGGEIHGEQELASLSEDEAIVFLNRDAKVNTGRAPNKWENQEKPDLCQKMVEHDVFAVVSAKTFREFKKDLQQRIRSFRTRRPENRKTEVRSEEL